VWLFPYVHVLCVLHVHCHLNISCARRKTLKNYLKLTIAVHDSDWFRKGFCMRGGRFRPKILKSSDQISRSEKGNIHFYAVVRDSNTVDTTVVMFK
jgi:hypothetical protein